MNKKTLVALIGFVILSMTVVGGNNSYAQTTPSRQTIIDTLVSKFGLNKTEVETVFNDFQKQRQSDMATGFIDRLDQLVKDGKLTQAQSELILEKRTQMVAQKNDPSWRSLTPQLRRTKMVEQRTDLEKWASDNKIDLKYLPFLVGKAGRGFGPGHP